MAIGAGTGVFVTYHVITRPGRRNSGPPYSQAQFPGGSCKWEKKERPLITDSIGLWGVGRVGKS